MQPGLTYRNYTDLLILNETASTESLRLYKNNRGNTVSKCMTVLPSDS